ncbi:bifunctional ornithine acetyltransferase/N-acetylglutamate synthase [Orenia metallireducens]|jgi:glutamate N-acetyltransferase/amino-acid N-acetyltransferase|uniref:Arginine biosynthesis bifunctional protein ArgJ n=1 Tax=Orenia metallireducens TaxID=1413210 RepID=A0A1C0AAA7_9FIRM|nr:bifunctional glutamate N-acetyltransferase/amino-acid acetyltransferase ArgJ [Orenia metallireducens]OCL27189.1 bifunctional ornithine acetyltransferase/N-acetylglutamate synthase [Orenia metallireducens]
MANLYKEISGGVTAPQGFLASGVTGGIKKSGKKDTALIYSETPAKVAGVFTTNQCAASCVLLNKQNIQDGLAQGIIINSGNANACTGERGYQDSQEMISFTAEKLGLENDKVLVASTGIIGEFLAMDKIKIGIEKAVAELSESGGQAAAEAIMTTDTYAKELAIEFELGDKIVKLGGIAKGSGMIEPNMATMLGFLTTDIAIDNQLLQEALVEAINQSFNRITVDGDQSTNDMVTVLANGNAGNDTITNKGEDYNLFLEALKYVCTYLAHQIVRDGEGATKFIEVEVKGAQSLAKATKVAKQIANSQLVKTAMFGQDPNWGRIIMAIGASGVEIDLSKVEIKVNDLILLEQNQKVIQHSTDIKANLLNDDEIKIEVDLNLGEYSDKVWTCDLSYKYVEINAEYHT